MESQYHLSFKEDYHQKKFHGQIITLLSDKIICED